MIFRKDDCGVSDMPKIGFFAAITALAAVVLFRCISGPLNHGRIVPARWDAPIQLLALHCGPIHYWDTRFSLCGTDRREILEQRSPYFRSYVRHLRKFELRSSVGDLHPSGGAGKARPSPHSRPNSALLFWDVDAVEKIG
jgi:hypothetical protein